MAEANMASPRCIRVSLHPQSEMFAFSCIDDKVNLTSIQSVFPQATGLKHFQNSQWNVVPIENGKFLLPVDVDQLIVISGSIGQARQIVTGSGFSLASQLASAFRPTCNMQPGNQMTSSIFGIHQKTEKTTQSKAFIKE